MKLEDRFGKSHRGEQFPALTQVLEKHELPRSLVLPSFTSARICPGDTYYDLPARLMIEILAYTFGAGFVLNNRG